MHSTKVVATISSSTAQQTAPQSSEKSLQKSAPQRLMLQGSCGTAEDSATALLREATTTRANVSTMDSQRSKDTEATPTASAAAVPCISDWVCSTTQHSFKEAPADTVWPCATMMSCNSSVGNEEEDEETTTTTIANRSQASLQPLISHSKGDAPTSSKTTLHSSYSLSSLFPSTLFSHTCTSSPSSRSYPLFIHAHLPHFTFLPLLLAALFFIAVAAHSSASATAIFGQKKPETVTDGSSSSNGNSFTSTLPSVPQAVPHIKSSHLSSSQFHPNQPLSPLAAPPAQHQQQRQQHSISSNIQERLNPIEMMMLSNLINQKQLHHPEYHYQPSRSSAFAEHIFDPSSEEITDLNLESSARTISAAQKRDIHEAIDSMYGIQRRAGAAAGAATGAGQQTGGSSSGGSAPAEGSLELQQQQEKQQQYYPYHHAKTASYHRHHQAMDNEGEEMGGFKSDEGTGMEQHFPVEQQHTVPSDSVFARDIPKWLFWLHPARTHLTLGEAHALVKSVINNGLVEKLDFKTLEHLTRKYAPGAAETDKDEDFIELHSETSNESADVADISKRNGGNNKMTAVKFESEDPLNPEEELLTVKVENDQNKKESNGKSGGDGFVKNTPDNGRSGTSSAGGNGQDKSSSGNSNPFGSAIINEDLFKNYQNLEQVMEILMHSENTLKKRGEGPQLSIDSALTVLRERLLLELARRKAKATEKQIQINTEILKKLGRRRRRRSVNTDWQFVDVAEEEDGEKRQSLPSSRQRQQQQQQQQTIDCDEAKCNLHDLNSKWSNVHQSLANLLGNYHVGAVVAAPASFNRNTAAVGDSHLPLRLRPYFGGSSLSSSSQRFRNNDKYIAAFDAEDDDADQKGNQLEVESSAASAAAAPTSEISADQDQLFEGIKDVYQQHSSPQNRLTYSNSQQQQQQQPAAFLANSARIRINSRKPALRLRLPARPSAVDSFRRAKLSRQWRPE